ncbi:hypothetical protein XBFFL1_850010 [Xenorhabdus bovienii str. feltiae Florida]|nr:hypothetical protein XBFFR1_2390044 [Xenorhabdus bovienii str. feltiae France]CDG94647.1 hypothetical protein XBFFL1_850010 [Xenorhabdus bovienii str. feltiae Florida]
MIAKQAYYWNTYEKSYIRFCVVSSLAKFNAKRLMIVRNSAPFLS